MQHSSAWVLKVSIFFVSIVSVGSSFCAGRDQDEIVYLANELISDIIEPNSLTACLNPTTKQLLFSEKLMEDVLQSFGASAKEIRSSRNRTNRAKIERLITALPATRAPRINSPTDDSPIEPVAPFSCDLTQLLRLLAIIKKRLGSTTQSSCEQTVLGILGNSCNILGPNETISSGIKKLQSCCSGTFTAIEDLKNTMVQDFNETWTILATISTLTATNCCNATFTVLADIKNTIVTDFNNTWTAIADVKNTVISDFNETWTILNGISTCCNNTATALTSLTQTTSLLYADNCSPTAILQANATLTTFTITRPGRYILAENITFSPTSPQRAIDIQSSGVTLDLHCFSIQQGNTTQNVDAIAIASGLTDVVIRNGTLKNFSRAGITVNSACSRINLDSISTFSCDIRGLEFVGSAGNAITESIVQNCNFLSCCRAPTADIVMSFSYCADLYVQNCKANQNGTTVHNLQVIRLDNVIKASLEEINANDNLASTDFRGYEFSNSSLCSLKNCTTKNNRATAAASAARGFILESNTTCTANSFMQCFALNNTGTGTVDGFLTGTGCDDNIFTLCQSSYNSSQGDSATAIVRGFNSINNSRNSYIDCIAQKNSAPNSTTSTLIFGAAGFECNTTTQNILLRCMASNQSTGAGSTAVGFKMFQGSECSVRDCMSAYNPVGYRLDPNNSTTHVFTRNIANKNTTNYSQFPNGSTQNAATISNINAQLSSPWTNASIG